MTDDSTTHEASATAYPDPLWFWLAYAFFSLVASCLVCPMYSDFIGFLPVGYVLITIAAAFTPRRSRTASRGIMLAAVGAIFPLAAVLLVMGIFKLFDLGGPVR